MAFFNGGVMELREKLQKLIDHWLHHQDEHRDNFLRWAEEAERAELKEVAALLRAVAEDMTVAKRRLEEAKRMIEEVK